MNVVLTVLGIAARLARLRIQRARDAAIQDALAKLGARSTPAGSADPATTSSTNNSTTPPPPGS